MDIHGILIKFVILPPQMVIFEVLKYLHENG